MRPIDADKGGEGKQECCPLKFIGGNNYYAQHPFCEEELCAWYLTNKKRCAIAADKER